MAHQSPFDVIVDTPERANTPMELSGRGYMSDDEESIREDAPLTADDDDDRGISSNKWKRDNRWKLFRRRVRYYVPVFRWLPSYSLDTFWSDFFAGLTLSCVLLPSGLSFSMLAKLPPVHGLYTIVIAGVMYAFLGNSRQLSIGPEALVAMLTGSAVVQNGGLDDPDKAVMIASTVVMFVGLITLGLGLVRLGFIDSILSRALLRGFITAVAIVIIVDQLINMFGLTTLAESDGITHASSTAKKLLFIFENHNDSHWYTFVVSFSSFTFLLVSREMKQQLSKLYSWMQFIPEVLICVTIFTTLSSVMRWDEEGVKILGLIKGGGFPGFRIPIPPKDMDLKVKECFETAVLVAVVGYVESVAITKTYATKHNYAVSPNRELVALGTANLVASFFQCIPAYGGMARSSINDRAGARTQLAGLVCALFVLFSLFFLLPLFYYLPKAVLASIVCTAALSLLNETPHDLRFMFRVRAWTDLSLYLLTFFVTIFVSIEYGTLISVALSLLLVVKHSTYPRITILGRMDDSGKFKPIKDFPHQAKHIEGVLVIRIAEPLYFANTGQLKDRLGRLEAFGDMSVHPSEDAWMNPVHSVIFDIETMEGLDGSAAQILDEIVEAYGRRGVNVYFVKMRENQKRMFIRAGIWDRAGGESHFFQRIPEALEHINQQRSALYSD